MGKSGEARPMRRRQAAQGSRIPPGQEGLVWRSIRVAPPCVPAKSGKERTPIPERRASFSVPGDKWAPDVFNEGAQKVRRSGR